MLDPRALAAVSSPRRLEILRLIWLTERPAGAIHEAMAVSLQLRALVDAGLIAMRRAGRQRFYRARPEAFGDLAGALERMWDDALWRLKLQAELEASRRGPKPRRTRTRTSSTRKRQP
jgi:DNA-binding transcriptional ArsR family regulator